MHIMEKFINLLILALTLGLGIICIKNPFIIARLIALWFKFASGNSFEHYKSSNTRLNEVYELIDSPNLYEERFSRQIDTIRRTGYVAIFVVVIGVCIALSGGSR